MKQTVYLIVFVCLCLTGCSAIRGQSQERADRVAVPQHDTYLQDPEYIQYANAVRRKIGKTLKDIGRSNDSGNLMLEFELSSSGRLLRYRIDETQSQASQELITEAISALRLSYPFEPFPRSLKRKYDKLEFTINLSRK